MLSIVKKVYSEAVCTSSCTKKEDGIILIPATIDDSFLLKKDMLKIFSGFILLPIMAPSQGF